MGASANWLSWEASFPKCESKVPDPELFYHHGSRLHVMSKKKLLIALITLVVIAYILKEKR
ncbi:hypothetical protein Huta_0522 [Halorhabdus utahensis DSM 12940]|uniref:Uncharacterized protein n=1 Tax=Halorhabdus utahensis (strain DSM 12940 / JCM 11049 / AX-2) TaxID=519442 RepID=C7NSP8_HALUD|nr:hypothetical protein Huta_0522 [Halorhabdus utahensis DSM 12940]